MRGQLRADASQQSVFRRDLKRRLKREALGRAMRRGGPEITSVEPALGSIAQDWCSEKRKLQRYGGDRGDAEYGRSWGAGGSWCGY